MSSRVGRCLQNVFAQQILLAGDLPLKRMVNGVVVVVSIYGSVRVGGA